jgi:hypothetical protein
MRIFLAAIFALLFATPATAQYGPASGSYGNQQNAMDRATVPAPKKATAKKKKATAPYYQPYRGSRYSTDPSFDVYVNGLYVGSDPDPRIRASLAAEARSGVNMR